MANQAIPAGYWQDASGSLIPESKIKDIDKLRHQVVTDLCLMAEKSRDGLADFKARAMQEVAALCDRIVIIAQGRVMAEGTPDELRAKAGTENLEDAFVQLIGTEEGLHA